MLLVWRSQKHAQLLQVGFSKVIGLPGDYSYQWKERQLMVMIAAEGPTCVLTIVDLQVILSHPAHASYLTTLLSPLICLSRFFLSSLSPSWLSKS